MDKKPKVNSDGFHCDFDCQFMDYEGDCMATCFLTEKPLDFYDGYIAHCVPENVALDE